MPRPEPTPRLLELEVSARNIAAGISAMLPESTAFTLLLADMGEKGHTTYISNAQREDMIKLMKELIERWEAQDMGT